MVKLYQSMVWSWKISFKIYPAWGKRTQLTLQKNRNFTSQLTLSRLLFEHRVLLLPSTKFTLKLQLNLLHDYPTLSLKIQTYHCRYIYALLREHALFNSKISVEISLASMWWYLLTQHRSSQMLVDNIISTNANEWGKLCEFHSLFLFPSKN